MSRRYSTDRPLSVLLTAGFLVGIGLLKDRADFGGDDLGDDGVAVHVEERLVIDAAAEVATTSFGIEESLPRESGIVEMAASVEMAAPDEHIVEEGNVTVEVELVSEVPVAEVETDVAPIQPVAPKETVQPVPERSGSAPAPFPNPPIPFRATAMTDSIGIPEEIRRPVGEAPVAARGTRSEVEPEVVELPEITEGEARRKVVARMGGVRRLLDMEKMSKAFLGARMALQQRGIHLERVRTLAIADFTLPSYVRRLALYQPRTGKASRHLVAHGINSGKLYAREFSNIVGSKQSSPGLYRIGVRYQGEHGPALKLHGLDFGINDKAYRRDIVLHSAWYVSYKTIWQNVLEEGIPRIGRSHGCPVVSREDLERVLSRLGSGDFLYIHANPVAGDSVAQATAGAGNAARNAF